MFITLTAQNDFKVSVNIDKIRYICEEREIDFKSGLSFESDHYIRVKETREEILKKIENARLREVN